MNERVGERVRGWEREQAITVEQNVVTVTAHIGILSDYVQQLTGDHGRVFAVIGVRVVVQVLHHSWEGGEGEGERGRGGRGDRERGEGGGGGRGGEDWLVNISTRSRRHC